MNGSKNCEGDFQIDDGGTFYKNCFSQLFRFYIMVFCSNDCLTCGVFLSCFSLISFSIIQLLTDD